MTNNKVLKNNKVVVLLSGGIDSSVLLYYVKKSKGLEPIGLIVDYGQRPNLEIDCAISLCKSLGCEYELFLLGNLSKVLSMDLQNVVIPNRNAILLSIAAAYAAKNDLHTVYYGPNINDYEMFPDCRKEFVKSLEKAFRLSLGKFINLRAPFINFSKSKIIQIGHKLQVPFYLTFSCYIGNKYHCGKCLSCIERKNAFKEANIDDPTYYEDSI